MSNKWNEIGAREKMQIVNGTALVFSAIILYFLSFLLTMTIGVGVISAGATLLATGLAFFGITSYIKNQMMEFETKVNKKMKQLEDIEQSRKYE
jgi:hypothetical protein